MREILIRSIYTALSRIKQRISIAERRYGRVPGSVKLLAVSKTKTEEEIQAAVNMGQLDFAENYLQEAGDKIINLDNHHLTWHFIGTVQSNKVRHIAGHFQWVHSIDRSKIAKKLSKSRSISEPPLSICLQVNTSCEKTKGGANVDDLRRLADECMFLPNIRLRGLMAMPAPESDFERQRAAFRQLGELFAELRSEYTELDTLSMGTTDDFEAAIAEGATIVRIGTAIFGKRNRQVL